MIETWYRVWLNAIKAVHVSDETKDFVQLVGHRGKSKKVSSYESFHRTFEEAKAHLVECRGNDVRKAEDKLAYYRRQLEAAEASTDPNAV